MKDLGKEQSPIDDKNLTEIFYQSQNNGYEYPSESAMDSHLQDFFQKNNTNQKDDIRDVAKYMANLKKKHMESLEDDCPNRNINDSGDMSNNSSSKKKQSDTTDALQNVISKHPDKFETTTSEDVENLQEMKSKNKIDKKVDKTFNGDRKKGPEKVCVSPQLISSSVKVVRSSRSNMDKHKSPDRSRSTGSSPVRLLHVKGTGTNTGAMKKVTDTSKDKLLNARKHSDSGILKRSTSPKSKTSPSCLTPNGILKRSLSPANSKSPDRKSLSPCNSIVSKSPDYGHRISKSGSNSPDRISTKYLNHSLFPSESFDSQFSENTYNQNLSVKNQRRRSGSKSPDRRSLSASAKSSFDSNRSYDREIFYSNLLANQESCSIENPETCYRRKAKSLDRHMKNTLNHRMSSTSPDYSQQYGLLKSHSIENNSIPYEANYSQIPSQSMHNAIENLTCVECIMQQRPPPKQKQKVRQSRTRKKIPRDPRPVSQSLERSNSQTRNCMDCDDFYEINV
jgi:hypothetical protein